MDRCAPRPQRSPTESPLVGCDFSECSSTMTTLLHAADLLMITSDVEGMPGAAIEAAMSGVPVLATDVGALSTMPGCTS